MRIAIAGYGVEGRSSYDYWLSGDNDVTIVDQSVDLTTTPNFPDNAKTILGPDAFERLDGFDLVIRTPGLAPNKIKTNGKIWSATNEFFKNCPAPIIGVTGSKGKGTTASFIASILEAAERTVWLVGNIGKPALDILPSVKPDDIVVYELSSFQLWDIEASPEVAVLLGIEPDHLDVHTSMDDYVSAKANITRFQKPNDKLIYNATNQYSKVIAGQSVAQKIEYPIDISEYVQFIQLPGRHNIENASAAILAAHDYVTNHDVIAAGLANFHGLPHRLKLVTEKAGVTYYDDSIATTPGSAIAAINSFNQPKVIILGGSDKGASYEEVVELCLKTNTKVIAIGQTGSVIADICQRLGVTCVRENGDMPTIVKKAAEIAQNGSIVILSPASASFDMFSNYAERGDQFIAAVEAL